LLRHGKVSHLEEWCTFWVREEMSQEEEGRATTKRRVNNADDK